MHGLITAFFRCAWCGEEIETSVDPGGGRTQRYVEDCSVCCRPNVLQVSISEEGEAAVESFPEE